MVLIFYTTYNNIHKKCNKLPITHAKWNIECIHFFFLPTPYNIAPIVYTTPPNNSNINPAVPSNVGNIDPFIIMHHPITK